MNKIGEIIKATALKYEGIREKPNNSGFHSDDFERKIKECGWATGQAWCSYFCELVWKEVYLKHNPGIAILLNTLFSSSATATYKNFDVSPEFNVSKVPVVGAIVIWRHGIGWQGHAGIVVNVNKNFDSIEGNTNASGGREGVEVAIKPRNLDFSVKPDQLNLLGFVIPKEV